MEKVKTPQEQWKDLDPECKECWRRILGALPIRPDCSDRDCPPDLLERKGGKERR